jgi:hypothetical protein
MHPAQAGDCCDPHAAVPHLLLAVGGCHATLRTCGVPCREENAGSCFATISVGQCMRRRKEWALPTVTADERESEIRCNVADENDACYCTWRSNRRRTFSAFSGTLLTPSANAVRAVAPCPLACVRHDAVSYPATLRQILKSSVAASPATTPSTRQAWVVCKFSRGVLATTVRKD